MKLVEGGKLQRPNVCWICQRTPAIGSPVIDTEKYFEGYPHNLQGRMYVCEKCALEIAKHFDLADAETIRLARREAEQAAFILRGLKQRLDGIVYDLVHIAESPEAFVQVVGVGGAQGSEQESRTEVDGFQGDQSNLSGEDRTPRKPNRSSKRGHRAAEVDPESSESFA